MLLSTSVFAEEVVDPRFAYSFELGGTVGSASIFGDRGYSQLVLGGSLTFLAPVRENRKVSIGLRGVHGQGGSSVGWFETLVIGYRLLAEHETLQTRFDVQLAADLSRIIPSTGAALQTRPAVGPRGAAGALFLLGRGWRVGGEVSAAVLVPRPRIQFELSPILSFSW